MPFVPDTAQQGRFVPDQPATPMQKVQASGPMRFVQGMRDSIDAGAQDLAHWMPESVTNALDYLPAKLRNSDSPLLQTIGESFFADPRAAATDKRLSDTEQQYQQARQATAPKTLSGQITGREDPGFDAFRFGGNVASPTNAALAAVTPTAALSTGWRMAGTGAALGATGGALTPVTDPKEQANFGQSKAIQTGLGTVTGAVLTPIVGKVLQTVAPYVSRLIDKFAGTSEAAGARASLETDNVISQALKDMGQTIDDIPKAQYQALRDQVNTALKQGKKLDPAAILRKGDFDAMGLPYTQGQLTRDPTQFATEKNLRGVAGVGEPLQQRFDVQNQGLQQLYGGFAKGASEAQTAGEKLIGALKASDVPVKQAVDNAYGAARDNLGRAAPMDAKGFSDAANLALDDGMLGHYLPGQVRNILNDVSAGKIPFNVNTAVQIDSVLSSAQRAAGARTPEALAIGKVRDALNSTNIESGIGEDAKKAFDAARGLAQKRFAAQDALPALKDALSGDASPDRFVQKYIISADTPTVKTLAKALTPEAFQEAKSQLGATIQRAAFGENLAGDKLLAPERLSKALRTIGMEKLSAFFSPQEIEQMTRGARVGAYINSTPTSAAVNYSNTAGAALNLAGQIPGIGAKVNWLRGPVQSIINQRTVANAVNPQIPQTAAGATPEMIRRAQIAAALSGLVGGGAVAPR